MAKILFLQSTNLDTACDSPKWKNFDLGLSSSSSSVEVYSNNINTVLTAAFDIALSSSVGSFSTILTSSIKVTSLSGAVDYQFRITYLSGNCLRLTSSNFTPVYNSIGIKVDHYPIIWTNRINKVRLEVFLRSISGSATNINISKNESFLNICPWF